MVQTTKAYNLQYSILFVLFVLRFYGPVNPMGHIERDQFT